MPERNLMPVHVLPMLGTIRVKGSPKLVSALLDRTSETRIGTVSIRLDACGDCYISLALASDEPFHYAYAQTGTARRHRHESGKLFHGQRRRGC